MVQERHKQTQVMVDKVFSFAELGFHEVASSTYLTGILEEAGFEITRDVSGIPTAWFARWSNGEGPVIALGSDVEGCKPPLHRPISQQSTDTPRGRSEGNDAEGLPVLRSLRRN